VHQCAMVTDRLCAHALAGSCCGLGLKPETLNRASPCPSASTAWWLRRAGVLLGVGVQCQHRRLEHCACYQFGRSMRPLQYGCRYDRAEGRFGTCIRIYTCVCVCAFHAYTYNIHLSVYVRIGRGYVCVHQCAMGMDRLCAHALAGSCCGLGLKPETLNRASPCPSAWTAWWLRRAGALPGVGVQCQHRRVEHRVGVEHGLCMRRSRPGGAHFGGRSAGLRCGAAGCARRHRR
jgi:hypothetical protein